MRRGECERVLARVCRRLFFVRICCFGGGRGRRAGRAVRKAGAEQRTNQGRRQREGRGTRAREETRPCRVYLRASFSPLLMRLSARVTLAVQSARCPVLRRVLLLRPRFGANKENDDRPSAYSGGFRTVSHTNTQGCKEKNMRYQTLKWEQ